MAFKTNTEMAEMYEAAIVAVVEGGNASYTIAGRTFNKNDLSLLHKLFEYYKSKANEETWGCVTLSDMSSGGGG